MEKERIRNSEPLKYFSRYEKKEPEPEPIKDTSLKSRKKKITKENSKQYYLYRGMAYMGDKYGDNIFEWIKENDIKYIKPQKFLKRHSLRKETRTKMVDWMVEVFYLTKSEPSTFELAVHIMDRYISRTKKILYDININLIGLTCIYLASKMTEDFPLKLIHISKNIGKGEFINSDIIEKEKEISNTINYDFIEAGIYGILMAFFQDLQLNYYKRINELDGKKIISEYMDFCFLLSKLVLYNEGLLSYKTSFISIVILSFGLDILILRKKELTKDLRVFLVEWINYLKNELDILSYDIEWLYKEILQLYKTYLYIPISQINYVKNQKKRRRYSEQINLLKYYKDKLL